MAQVNPNAHKEEEIRTDDWRIDVVQYLGCLLNESALPVAPEPVSSGFLASHGAASTYSKKEVTDVVSRVNCQPHIGEVEAVAKSNQRKTDDVMTNQLLEVLPGFLHTQQQDDCLLSPVGSLEKIIELEASLVCHMREVLVHASGTVVPDGRLAHDVQTGRSKAAEINGSVHLLHETSLLAARADSGGASEWPQKFLHDEFPSKSQNNGPK